MRLFRYRNLGPLAFKELLYREIYLASPSELNDPLDLNAQIDFRPRNRKDLALLSAFLLREAAVAHSQIELIPKLRGLFSRENFERRFENQDGSLQEGYLSEAGLFEIISLSYRDFFKDQPLFDHIDVKQLHKVLEGICSQVTKNYAVACFSEKNNDFLMWSHYAAGHTGICLEYDFPDIEEGVCEFDCETRYLYEGKFIHYPEKIRRVEYRDLLTTLSFYDFLEVFFNYNDIDLIHLSKGVWHYYAELISRQYLQKLQPWCSEQEWRIVRPSFKETFQEERVLNYPEESLKSVYFGVKVTEQNKLRVQNVTRYNGGPKYYNAIVDGTRTIRFQDAFE